MEVTRTFDLLERYEQNFLKTEALSVKKNGKWTHYTTLEFIDTCYQTAYGLLESGIKKGDKILTATNNRPEWNFIDHAMSMCGIIHVPVYTSLNEEEYTYIIEHSEAKMALVADKRLYDLLLPGCKKAGIDKKLLTFDAIEGIPAFSTLIETGKKTKDKHEKTLQETKASIQPGDFSSLLYTSGTTGKPKGVMLSHENLVKNFILAAGVFKLSPDDKYLSILPLCHVGGRLGNYQTQYSGSGIYYPENMGAFVQAMKDIGANGFDAVPRVLEKVYDNITARGRQLSGMKKKMFFWAVNLGFKYNVYGKNGWWYRKRLAIADKLIFTKWREALGNEVRLVGCGGASLQPKLERLFWAAGVKIINMYGLTETSPIITISSQEKGKIKLGTVGRLIDGVELKIAEDGEILCRGHNVMLGYYKDEKLSREVFDEEGWFHTGDIGKLEDGIFLSVTDRKKEIFKLSNGKYIAPQYIEGIFKQSQFIDQLMVVGEQQKFASAIISPAFDQLKAWADENGVSFSSNEELICMPEVQRFIQKETDRFNKALSKHEQLLRFRLVKDVWSPDSGELSPTLKLKRRQVNEKYKLLIDSIYN
ncbi:AMP-dependent synthetase/ligase [Bacteroidota bacterium]